MRNALHLLDGYVSQEMKNEMPVHIYTAGVQLSVEDADYPHTALKEAELMPLGIFEAAPPKGGVITMSVQAQSDTHVSIVFSGSTYNLRQKFESGGAPGAWLNPEGQTPEEKGPYLRTMKDVNVATEGLGGRARVSALLTDALSDMCFKVVVDGNEKLEEDCPTALFIKDLRNRRNYHFI